MSDQPQKTTLPSFQDSFIKAISTRETEYVVRGRILTVRRWALTQQFKLGAPLNEIVRHLLMGIPGFGENKDIDLTALAGQLLQMSSFFETQADNIAKVVIGSITHNFTSREEATAFYESMDAPEAVQLMLLIGTINIVRDDAKKKYQEIAEAMQKQKSPSP